MLADRLEKSSLPGRVRHFPALSYLGAMRFSKAQPVRVPPFSFTRDG